MLTSLPNNIQVNEKTLVPVIGLDYHLALTIAKANKVTYKTIKVLARNLRGKSDLHGKPYQPTVWLFVDNNNISLFV